MTTTTTAILENRKRFSITKLLLEGRAFLALILIIAVFSILSPNYLTWNNILIMTSHVAIYALLGLGMLLVILNGGIDLSVGSTLAFSAVIAGFLLKGVPLEMFGVTLYPSVPVTVLIACGVGALVGLVNGILVAKFKIAPFVATLGMLYAVRGLALLMTGGLTINNLSGSEDLGNTGFDWLGFNRILGIPIGVLIMIVVAIVLGAVLGRAKFGRWLYAAGGNERAAELSGVPTKNVKYLGVRDLRPVRRDRRPGSGLHTHQCRPQRRRDLRADGNRGRRDRGSGAHGRTRQCARHAAGRLRDRLPRRRARDHRSLRVLADGVHGRGHRRRRASQHLAVRSSPACGEAEEEDHVDGRDDARCIGRTVWCGDVRIIDEGTLNRTTGTDERCRHPEKGHITCSE